MATRHTSKDRDSCDTEFSSPQEHSLCFRFLRKRLPGLQCFNLSKLQNPPGFASAVHYLQRLTLDSMLCLLASTLKDMGRSELQDAFLVSRPPISYGSYLRIDIGKIHQSLLNGY